MGVLRTAIDNLVTQLQDPVVRAAVPAKWLTKFDAAVTDLTAQRAGIPNNDNLAALTKAQLQLVDSKLTTFFERFVERDGQGVVTVEAWADGTITVAQLYNFVAIVDNDIRGECRRLIAAQGG
jgi:hypothetical protein